MAINREVLNVHFNEDEYQKVEQRIKIDDDTSFKEKYEKIKQDPEYRLSVLEERIDKKEQKFADRFEAFKKAVLDLDSWNETTQRWETITDKKQKIKDAYIKKLSDTPIIWGILVWMLESAEEYEKEETGFFKKVMWFFSSMILWIFWYNDYKNELKWLADIQTELPETITNAVTAVVPEKKQQVEKQSEQKEVSIEDKKNTHFGIWKLIVQEMWSDEIFSDASDNTFYVFDAIKQQTYNGLSSFDYIQTDDFSRENLDKVKKTVLGVDSETIFENILTQKNIDKLLSKESSRKILSNLDLWDTSNFDWKKLKIEDLLILLSVSISSFSAIALGNFWKLWEDVISNLLDYRLDISFDDIKEDLSEYEKEVIPKELLLKLDDLEELTASSSKNMTKEEFLSKLELTEQEKIYIDRLFDFKNFVIENILNNSRYTLWEQTNISKETSFKDIIQLYVLFSWETPSWPQAIDSIKSSLVYIWIYNGLDEKWLQWAYITRLSENLSSEEEDYVKKEDKKLLKLLTRKFIDKTMWEDLKKAIWITTDWIWTKIEWNEFEVSAAATASLLALFKVTPIWRLVSVLKYAKGIIWSTALFVFAWFYQSLKAEERKEVDVMLKKAWLYDELQEELKKEQEQGFSIKKWVSELVEKFSD